MEIESETALVWSVLLQNTPLPREIGELVLDYVRWIVDGYYTRNNLENIPVNINVVCTLNLCVCTLKGSLFPIVYEGEVDMRRNHVDRFDIKFTVAGENHTWSDGFLAHENSGEMRIIFLPRYDTMYLLPEN